MFGWNDDEESVQQEEEDHHHHLWSLQQRQLTYKFTPAASPASPASPASTLKSPGARKRMPSNKMPATKKKSVRWGSAYAYKSTNQEEDIPIMWYTRQDLDVFQREKRKIIRALKHVKGDLSALEGTKYVTRGFECYQSVPFNRRVRQQRSRVVQGVLELQQQQQQQQQQHAADADASGNAAAAVVVVGADPQQQLAEASRRESAWAREWALELGAQDAKMNETVWQEFFVTDAAAAATPNEPSSDSEASLSSDTSGDESSSANSHDADANPMHPDAAGVIDMTQE